MPVNRNTLLRYKTIDRMLRKGRKVTLDELIEACNDALYETNGYGEVSRRTIQHDIQEMRYSQALGYYAPIKVVDKKYYKYDEYGYSITQIPISSEDMAQLSEAVDLLKQMSSFKGFDGVEDVVNRLEDYVASMRYKVEPVILLESNERLRGLEYITDLHDAIMNKEPIEITYKSFRSTEAQTFCFSPYILKEFRNRWFVFGDRHDFTYTPLCNLALDRIEGISNAPKGERYLKDRSFQPGSYFKDMIGVTRDIESPVEHITFIASATEAPYLRTKPLHQSQKELGIQSDGSVLFCIDVILNHELERDLLGYGEGITVLSPDSLVEKIHKRLAETLENYEKRRKK
ncbi:MAG: WYL domain-containing protein [Prevotella sp.]|nr:WYL domain-containing protein [Prevotella sp.]